jgi:hypothetical protein
MGRLLTQAAALVVILGGMTACQFGGVDNVEAAGFATSRAPLAQRAEQIRRAGGGLGWVMQEVGPGHITGTLTLDDRRASIDIRFSEGQFSISYVTSANLHYDGSHIDPAYNDWIEHLKASIRAQSSV